MSRQWSAWRPFVGSRSDLVAGTVLIALALACCLILYRPWEMVHFPMRDQSTVLEQFRDSPSFGRSFIRLSRFLLDEGRFFPLTKLALSASASAFGTDAVAWEIARFVMSFACLVLAWCVLRRYGASRFAATLGASLFAVAGSAAQSWTYTIVSELYGLPFLLGALWIAAGFHATTRPQWSAVGMGAMLLLAVFAKETFVACVPCVVLLALSHQGGGVYGVPRVFARRDRMMAITVLGVVAALGFLPSVVIKSSAPAGYAGGYSAANLTWTHADVLFRAFFSVATWVWLYPSNALFGLAVVLGTIAGLRRDARSTIWAAVLAISFPVVGWITYLPWRFTVAYYAVPYLFGLALLLTNAVSELERRAPKWRVPAIAVGATVMLVYASLVVRNGTAQFHAESFVEGEAAARIAKVAPRILLAAAPEGIGWVATDMRSYVYAYGGPRELSVKPVSCLGTDQAVPSDPGSALVVFSHVCSQTSASSTPAQEHIQRSYVMRDWKRWTSEARVVSGDLWYK